MIRQFLQQGGIVWLVAAALVAAAPAAADGKFYSWQTDAGTLAFTDDPKRVPARYRATATTRAFGDLAQYERTTVTTTGEALSYRTRLAQRRATLLASPGAVAFAAPGIVGAGTDEAAFLVRTSGGANGVSTQVGFPVSAGAGEPITTESVRVMPAEGDATRHITIVRQGNKVLSVVKPQLWQTSATFESEEDAVRD